MRRSAATASTTPTVRTRRPDGDRHLLGLRRHARASARRRGSTTRSRRRSPSRSGTDVVELARLLALVNVAMADAGIAIWESKYFYQFWRPVTGIREADAGHRPDRPRRRQPDDGRRPDLLAARRAGQQPDRVRTSRRRSRPIRRATPASAARCSRRCAAFYGTDDIAFTFVSDEFNGVTRRQRRRRAAAACRAPSRSLSQAEEENGQSRIYLGIHWAFDKTEGIAQGRQVADYVFEPRLPAGPLRPSGSGLALTHVLRFKT